MTQPAGSGARPSAYREFYRGRRVMITGGVGFVGRNLARQLQLVDLAAGWSLCVPLEEGLRRTLSSYCEHLPEYLTEHSGNEVLR